MRIIITAPDDPAAHRLAEGLRQCGVDVRMIPLVDIHPVHFTSPLLAQTSCDSPPENPEQPNAKPFDWLFFTSKNGVRAFLGEPATVESCKPIPIAVVGPATARELDTFGLRPAFVSPRFDGESAARSFLAEYAGPGSRILWPCGDRAHPELSVRLERAGCLVTPLVVYQTRLRHWDTLTDRDKNDLRLALRGSPSEPGAHPVSDSILVFTSPSAVEACDRLFPGSLAATQSAIACLGPITAEALHKQGALVTIQPGASTFSALHEAILGYLP